jgi:S-adenosylmethionine-dependent methyltransferase
MLVEPMPTSEPVRASEAGRASSSLSESQSPSAPFVESRRLTVVGPLGSALQSLLVKAQSSAGSNPVTVLDCGGGSGSLAVPLAAAGAHVTVLDVSIDALSILRRRAVEAGVDDRVRAIQADVETVTEIVDSSSFDIALLHGVLEASSADAVFAAVAAVVRPGGYLSVVTSNAAAAILIRAVTGDLAAALTLLRSDNHESTLNLDRLRRLTAEAGLEVVLEQGLGAISATVPGSIVAGQPRGAEMLAELDQLAAGRSPFREIADQLHLIAGRAPLDARPPLGI